MPTLKTVTLGCKVNQYETEYLRQGLARIGYREAQAQQAPDLCLVNTCTVTAEAEARGRKMIRLLARRYPHSRMIVMGCAATRAPDHTAALPGVAEVIADKRQLPALLARLGVGDVPAGISSFSSRRRAYVKVQDGCRDDCSYCIVPAVRPVLTSRTLPAVLDEIQALTAGGHREIVLTGVHLGHYGADLAAADQQSEAGLAGLVRAIVRLPGAFRVRLSSIEAAELGPELLALMASHPDRLCPHLHLPLQSGSNAVLQRMRRRYTVEQFIECCHNVRRVLDSVALTSDVIVGFPGETDEDFAATCRTVEEASLARIHVFRFSPRPGTPAATMPHQVQDSLKQRRAAELEQLSRALQRRFLESLLGQRLQALVESPLRDSAGWMYGTSAQYAPVALRGGNDLIGSLQDVRAENLTRIAKTGYVLRVVPG